VYPALQEQALALTAPVAFVTLEQFRTQAFVVVFQVKPFSQPQTPGEGWVVSEYWTNEQSKTQAVFTESQ
jgi:hypothetical protein